MDCSAGQLLLTACQQAGRILCSTGDSTTSGANLPVASQRVTAQTHSAYLIKRIQRSALFTRILSQDKTSHRQPAQAAAALSVFAGLGLLSAFVSLLAPSDAAAGLLSPDFSAALLSPSTVLLSPVPLALCLEPLLSVTYQPDPLK